MKVIYILPNKTVKSGGNWITVTRLAKGLEKRGITVDIIEVKDAKEEFLIKYDVIHAFHVFKSLLKIKDLLTDMEKTVIASFTGTDLKQLQEMKEGKKKIIDLLNKIDAIIVFHSEAREELIKEGIFLENIKIIPQATIPIEIDLSIEREIFIEDMFSTNSVKFIFAGGIRKVKGPLTLIEMMTNLIKKVENVKLIIIGTILEKELEEEFINTVRYKKWIKYFGDVSHQEAQYFISKSDIVINNSTSEGMSNALLEGQQLGKAILAKDNSGNRSIITHGVNGFLFKNEDEFEYYARKLIQNPRLRDRMGLSGLKSRNNYTWNHEICEYEKTYQNSKKLYS